MSSLEQRWDALEPDVGRPVFQLVDARHPLQFYIGRHTSGARLLLLVTPERPVIPTTLRAVTLAVHAREDGNWSLTISLDGADLAHVFAILCDDLINAGRHVPDRDRPVGFVLRRLAAWQRLLERGASGLLSPGEVRGLVGELVFLQDTLIPRLGARAAVEAWVGPLGADQDFQPAGEAWEIKTVRSTAERLPIASERQLWAPERELWLVATCLEESQEEGKRTFSLNSLVSDLRRELNTEVHALEIFEDRIAEARYVRRDEYGRPNFRLAWSRTFGVRGDFPRLVRDELREGIHHVEYELTLAACEPYLEDPSERIR